MRGETHIAVNVDHSTTLKMEEDYSEEQIVVCSSIEEVDRSFASVLLALRYSNDECERESKTKVNNKDQAIAYLKYHDERLTRIRKLHILHRFLS